MDDEDGNFEAQRQAAKNAKIPMNKAKASAAAPPVPTTDVDGPCDPHPSCFAGTAGEQALERARQAAKSQAEDAGDDIEELVQFFEMHGLSGPVRTYAKVFSVGGAKDPTELVGLEDARLERLLEAANLEADDEIILRGALDGFR
eukprot:gnl/MRDRNA2_/MRDRNA2_59925_c0_seq1.p1 gnl/MRDRNA2_/MRDRNA2_59925_c0~~gnl/MRDRNA2_/MRDRNA2_59925_c0_seq1.p1  ORF type:complete len:145 (-),score=45.08 gnl/MRDRNA2_/MRDRNA2_59925_c0_seq1:177-611(-)